MKDRTLYDIWFDECGDLRMPWCLQLSHYEAYFANQELAEQYRDSVKDYLKKQLDSKHRL